jgi:hypothetical protein
MSQDWKPIALKARRELLWLAGSVALTASLVFGSHFHAQSTLQSITRIGGQVGLQQTNLDGKHKDLENIQEHIREFRSLKEAGLVGVARREAWIEQLISSRAALRLEDNLLYSLNPPQTLITPDATGAEDPEAARNAPVTHDLEFELKGIHEKELLDFLEHYRTRVEGRFRIQSCIMTEPGAKGMLARCTLRFFTLPEPQEST